MLAEDVTFILTYKPKLHINRSALKAELEAEGLIVAEYPSQALDNANFRSLDIVLHYEGLSYEYFVNNILRKIK